MCVLYRFRKVGRGCFFATLYISSLSPVLSRFNCVVDKFPTHHLKRLYGRLFACCLMMWCIPCAWSGDRTSVVVTTVVVTPDAILRPASWSVCCRRLPSMVATDPIMYWLGSGRCLLSKSNHAFWWLGWSLGVLLVTPALCPLKFYSHIFPYFCWAVSVYLGRETNLQALKGGSFI